MWAGCHENFWNLHDPYDDFAPPKKPRNDDCLVDTIQKGFPWFQIGAGYRPSTV